MNIEKEILKVIEKMTTWDKLCFIQEQMRKTAVKDEFDVLANIEFSLFKRYREGNNADRQS